MDFETMISRGASAVFLPLGLGLLVVRAQAQGVLEFSNRGVDQEDRPVFGPDGALGLSGPRYSAQLLAGTNGTPAEFLVPVGAPQPFDRHGFWVSTNLVIPGVANNQIASLQVRVWDNENDRYPTFESASLKAASSRFTHRLNGRSPWDAMSRMASFSLPPGSPLPHPADSWLNLLAINQGGGSFGGGICYPGDPVDFQLSGSGNQLYYTRIHPCQQPAQVRSLTDLGTGLSIPVPGSEDVGEYPGLGPGRWSLAALSDDGRVVLGNVTSTNGTESRAYLGLTNRATPLPLSRGVALSGNGRYAFGTKSDGTWLRIEVSTGMALEIPVPDAVTNLVSIGVSQDGDSWLVGSGAGTGQAWWRRGFGWRILGSQDPLARHLSADGGTVTGSDRATSDAVLLASDGSRRTVPEARPLGWPVALCDGGRLLWCERGVLDLRTGRAFGVGELLHGDARSRFLAPDEPLSRIALDVRSVLAADARGRTIVFQAGSSSTRLGRSQVGYWYVARLAFPEDGAPVSLVRSGAERFRVRFPARAGIRYRVESSGDFRNWAERVAEHEGTGVDEEVDVDASGDGLGFLRIRATVLPP
jgi:hypothetical protein